MSATRELELKFDLDQAALDALSADGMLGQLDSVGKRTVSIYFNTKKHILWRQGITLRVRREGQSIVQTIKAETVRGAGLFDRSEWEAPIPDLQPDLALAEGTALEPLLARKGVAKALGPVFETRIQRRKWLLEVGASQIEIVLDQGEVKAGKTRRRIAELELELKQGSADALFELAHKINDQVPLRLSVLTKAGHGFRLLASMMERPVKAEPVIVTDKMTAGEGLIVIAFACIRHFRLNEALVITQRDGEALHQSRVALRRFRSALSMFKPILRGAQLEEVQHQLRWIASELGQARDIDVFLRKNFGSNGGSRSGLAKQLEAERERAFDQAIAALESARFRAFMIDLVRWISDGDWLRAPAPAATVRDQSLKSFAAFALDRSWRKVDKGGRKIDRIDDEARHDVRIAGKKLRYSSEFFAALYPADRRLDRRQRFVVALEELQASLGDLNDIVTAGDLSRSLAERLRLGERGRASLSKICGKQNAGRDELLASARAASIKLAEIGPFWR